MHRTWAVASIVWGQLTNTAGRADCTTTLEQWEALVTVACCKCGLEMLLSALLLARRETISAFRWSRLARPWRLAPTAALLRAGVSQRPPRVSTAAIEDGWSICRSQSCQRKA
jgi:hypothetical protein